MLSIRGAAAAGVLVLTTVGHARAQRVEFDRPGYRLNSIGQRLLTSVRVTDASGRSVPNPQPTFRVADPTIATVSPRGEVVSRKSGYTRIWAIAGKDSGSAYVVVDQRAARFAFSPSVLRIDALRTSVPLTIQVSDSAGVPMPGATSAAANCRSLNEQIAQLSARSEVIPRSNGATYIRCTDRGFADSLRVEVRQRPVRAQILPARSLRKTAGDTFTVQLRAFDRSSDSVRGARPTWVSMDPKVVTVDPTTGRALARGDGQTRLIAQLGDVADTATVNVDAPRGGGLLQAPIPVADTTPATTAAARRMTLRVNPVRMYEGETARLVYTVTDTLGINLVEPRVTVRFSDTSVVTPTDSGLKAKKIGQVYAYVRYQGLVDSAIVEVRDIAKKAEEMANSGTDSVRTTVADPTYTPGLLEKYQKERAALMDSIHRSGAFAPPSGRIWTAGIYAGLAAHSSNQTNSATSNLIEDRSGVIYGGRTSIKPLSWMALSGDLRLGNLTTKGTIGEALSIVEGTGDITFYLMPWLGLGGGYSTRYEKTKIAGQTWTIPHASITARSSFVGEFISTTTTFSVLPGATYTGMPTDQQPNIGLSGEGGLELRRGALDAGLTYYVERLPFPELRGRSRVDQFSSLRLRVGFKIGR